MLKNKRVDVNQQTNATESTPLCTACQQGHVDVIKFFKILLQNKNVDVNQADNTNVWQRVLHVEYYKQAAHLGSADALNIIWDTRVLS